MTVDYFKKLFEFDFWANEKVLDSMEAVPALPEETLKKMAHILVAKTVWLARIIPGFQALSFETQMPLADCRKWNAELKEVVEAFLSQLDPEHIGGKVGYKNLKGVPFENFLTDILAHMVNHGTYHRGQIASLVNKAGGKPAATDYIGFVRE